MVSATKVYNTQVCVSISIWNQILIEANSLYSNLSLRTGEGRHTDIISQALVPSRN